MVSAVQAIDEGLQPVTQAASETMQRVGDAVFSEANPIIRALNNMTKGMVSGDILGKAGISVGSKDLAGGLDTAPPPSMGKSENVQAQGRSQQIEKSVMPERVREQVQAMGSAGGMKVEHVAELDLGAIAPTAVSAGKQQSQGMGIG